MSHTPGPWEMGEYDEHFGYDCMTGGIRVGPVKLDGGNYGQKWCEPIAPDALAQMTADARLIAAAPELLDALHTLVANAESGDVPSAEALQWANEILARAEGK